MALSPEAKEFIYAFLMLVCIRELLTARGEIENRQGYSEGFFAGADAEHQRQEVEEKGE